MAEQKEEETEKKLAEREEETEKLEKNIGKLSKVVAWLCSLESCWSGLNPPQDIQDFMDRHN